MTTYYRIEIDGFFIGTTKFEFADVPMGVVYGKINFENIESPYSYVKNYCSQNNVKLNMDDKKLKLIDTVMIPKLKVYDSENNELFGWGGAITGIENEKEIDFEITFGGINHEIMETKFSKHYNEYYK